MTKREGAKAARDNLVDDVADLVKKAIEWLKAIFDWRDIINTKKVLKWIFLQNANNLQQLLSTSGLQTQINSFSLNWIGMSQTLSGSLKASSEETRSTASLPRVRATRC